MTGDELQRIARDWNALMAAQQSLGIAVANMTEHLQRLINAVAPPPSSPSPPNSHWGDQPDER